MNQRMLRTMMFVGAAAVCLGGAIATSIATRPVKLDDAALVGQEFFPDFQDPTKATALRVAAYDKEAARVNLFNVEFKDGLWRIPSHHNYPADGEEQLAKTAASVVGIERGLYAGKTPEDQKRMGVLDPLDESITGTEGRGARITLSQGGKTLVDMIVGNKVDESGNIYYVRRADEDRVYRAELTGLKVSTRFADWIEPDLLKLEPAKLVQMVIDRYQIDEQRGSLVQGEISVLDKDTTKSPAVWQLEGINPETEKVKTATVNQMTSSLDNLKIVGVREKPAGLIAALKGEQGAGLNQIEQIQMQRAGFFLTPDGQLVSNEGEILAGTNEGVRYTLRFGEVITGSDIEIEVGSAPDEESPSADPDTAEPDADNDAEADKNNEDITDENAKDDSSVKKNRYLFITAAFDEKLLGERPKAPLKPVPPTAEPAAEPTAEPAAESSDVPDTSSTGDDAPADGEPESDPLDVGDDEQDAADSAADEPADDNASTDEATNSNSDKPAADGDKSEAAAEDAKTEDAAASDTPAAEQPATSEGDKPEPPAEPDPQKVFEEAQKQYEADQKEYERKNAEFDKKIEDGEKLAKDLNDRFAPWYYVISADLFQKLKVDRSELVEPVTPATTTPGGATGTSPGTPSLTSPPATESDDSSTDDAATPASEPDEPKPSDSGEQTPAAEESAPNDAAEKPAADEPADSGDSASNASQDADATGPTSNQ